MTSRDLRLCLPWFREGRRVFDASSHSAWAGNAHVKVVVMGEHAARLDHDFRSTDTQCGGGSDALGMREKTRSERAGNEEVADMGSRVGEHGLHEGPVLRFVEMGSRVVGRGAVGFERQKRGGQYGLACLAAYKEPDVRVTTAFVRMVPVDLAAAWTGQVADRHHRIGELLVDHAGRAVDERDERFESPAHVAGRASRDNAQVRGLFEVKSAEKTPLGGRAYASSKAERRGRG